ncbi:MAG TPA: hypothetical protein ENN85_07625 [Methanoculleus sp.]|nr:hypothetical protein [Methanoculleus sp.]
MIVPAHCKEVGYASSKPLGDRVYFLSRYLIHETGGGFEVLAVQAGEGDGGMMRPVRKTRVLAREGEVAVHPEPVNLFNRADLVLRAAQSGKRCTIFRGPDEHMTFVLDPAPEALCRIHVYDAAPPYPSLSRTIAALEATGLFGELMIVFDHHVADIAALDADVFPCRASGYARTLDMDRPSPGERIAGCLTARQLAGENYKDRYSFVNICPLDAADSEPFIARCCRSERCGVGTHNGLFGAAVHWGASPKEIADAVVALVAQWGDRA